ncbi:unnamed protein product [Calypogeia fissa]
MNIPSSKSGRHSRDADYEEEFDHRSDDDTDVEKDEEDGPDHDEERLTDEQRVSTSGRGRRRDASDASFSGTPSWPQSYKASMDYHQIFPASSGERASFTLFSPIARISNSYLSSSIKRSRILGSRDDLQTALLPTKNEEGQHVSGRKPTVPKVEPDDLDHTYVPLKVVDVDKLREEQGSTFVQASLNGLNVLAGVGVLSTPYALKEGGYLGLSLLFVLALICCYTGILLRKCLDSQPGAGTYPDIGEAAFGPTGRLIISIILYVELYACCVEFLILEGDNLAVLFPEVSLNFIGVHMDATSFFCVVAALIVLPTVWLRDLSLLSYLSAGGVIATLVVVFAVFWVGAVDGVGFTRGSSILNLAGLPVSVGLYGFCYSGHAVFPNIYTSMKNPADFNKVLQVSFLIVSLIYGGIAIMGYTMFGEDIQSSITLNLPNELLASKIAVWTTVINPITKFALTMTPVALCLEELLPSDPDSFKGRSTSLAIRTALVASTIMVATMVPFFGLVMAFIGAFMSMTVSVILPCACFLSIMGDKATAFQRITCGLVILLGVVCAIAGTYSSVCAIVDSFYDT